MTKRHPKKRKFSGALAEPLEPPRWSGLLDEEENKNAWSSWQATRLRKLEVLKAHYGIEEQGYLELSLALATEFVPGFQPKTRMGRPKKWTSIVRGYLYADAMHLLSENNLPETAISEIAEQVARLPHWQDFLEKIDATGISSSPAEAIRTQFYEAKKDPLWTFVAWDSFRYYRDTDRLDEYYKNVRSALLQRNE
ncbi:MAG: hypothetical protein HEP70_09520 [Rhodobiaceae bacterium]|nr:hypothetical protein [Rhodobiaceae bacterium]